VHLVPIVLASGVAADRLLYLPLAGLILGLAVASTKLSPRGRKIAAGLALALGVTFVPVTRARARDYTNELLFRVVAAEHAHPHNPGAKSGLANVLRASGEVDLACRLHASSARSLEGIGRSADARRLRALENLGGCYALQGAYDRAAAVYAQAVVLNPENGRIHMQIGLLHLHVFALDDAEASLRKALVLDPTLDAAQRALATMAETRAGLAALPTEAARRADRTGWARVLVGVGRVPDATQAWLEIVLDPTSPMADAMNGFSFLIEYGDLKTARRATEAFLSRNPPTPIIARIRLTRRTAQQAKIDALRARLEALAR